MPKYTFTTEAHIGALYALSPELEMTRVFYELVPQPSETIPPPPAPAPEPQPPEAPNSPPPTQLPLPIPESSGGSGNASGGEGLLDGQGFFTWRAEGMVHRFKPLRIVVGATISAPDEWGIASKGEDGVLYVRCRFIGGRYGLYAEGRSNMGFIDCEFDVSAPALRGNEEAIIRVQDCRRVLFRRCRFVDGTGPKHAIRVHKFCEDVRFEGCTIDTNGSVALIGQYSGQDDRSALVRVEIVDTDCTAAGVDGFNPGIEDVYSECLVRNFVQRGMAPFRVPNRWAGLKVENFRRG